MKITTFFCTLSLGQFLLSQTTVKITDTIESCDFTLINIRQLTDGHEKYHRAILSPDAKKVLLFGKEKTQIMDIETKKIIRNIEYYHDGQWISNTAIMFQIPKGYKVYKLNQDIERVYLPVPELQIENKHILKANKNNREWIIADIEGSEYLEIYDYLFSDNFENIIIYTNEGSYIYKVDGSGQIAKKLLGIASDWSSDNKSIISFLDLDFGEHYIVESDLYIKIIEIEKLCKLTDTKEILETYPSWSQDKITYIEEKTKTVFIGEIHKL